MKDIIYIKDQAKKMNAKIITTEKDYVKLSSEEINGINFLEIGIKIKDEDKLIKFIKSNL